MSKILLAITVAITALLLLTTACGTATQSEEEIAEEIAEQKLDEADLAAWMDDCVGPIPMSFGDTRERTTDECQCVYDAAVDAHGSARALREYNENADPASRTAYNITHCVPQGN